MRNRPKRPRGWTPSSAPRPNDSTRPTGNARGWTVPPVIVSASPLAAHGVSVHAESPEREVLCVEVVLQVEDPREARAVPERVLPRSVVSLTLDQIADTLLDDP